MDESNEIDSILDRLNGPTLYAKLKMLLGSRPSEGIIHDWLRQHPIAFGADISVVTKPHLGAEYELDFFLVKNISTGLKWTIVELKQPDVQLFRKDGHFTVDVTSALTQVERYYEHISTHLDYLQATYPYLYHPKAIVFLGRREQVTNANQVLLRQFNATHDTNIVTYDRLLDNLRGVWSVNETFQNRNTEVLARALPKLQEKFCLNVEREGGC